MAEGTTIYPLYNTTRAPYLAPAPHFRMTRGQAAIPAGAEEVEVAHAFESTPTSIDCTVESPQAGGEVLYASAIKETISATGFTARIGPGSPSSPGHVLQWKATL
jgi:hypothetical protein